MVAASVLAAVFLLPACYRMTDDLAVPDGGFDASQAEDTGDGDSEGGVSPDGEDGEAGAGGQAGEAGSAGGTAGTGGIGPMDSGVGPDGGLGDGGPSNSGFPFGR
jgi:hypothetical protein